MSVCNSAPYRSLIAMFTIRTGRCRVCAACVTKKDEFRRALAGEVGLYTR